MKGIEMLSCEHRKHIISIFDFFYTFFVKILISVCEVRLNGALGTVGQIYTLLQQSVAETTV